MRPYNAGAQSGEDELGGRCWPDGLQPEWIPTHSGMLAFCSVCCKNAVTLKFNTTFFVPSKWEEPFSNGAE